MVRLSINFDRVVNHSKNASNNTNVISSGFKDRSLFDM